MPALGRLLPLEGREPRPDAALDPSMAQIQLWLAQAQRDHNRISDHEMARMEGAAGMLADRSTVMFNPFTGEIRVIEGRTPDWRGGGERLRDNAPAPWLAH